MHSINTRYSTHFKPYKIDLNKDSRNTKELGFKNSTNKILEKIRLEKMNEVEHIL